MKSILNSVIAVIVIACVCMTAIVGANYYFGDEEKGGQVVATYEGLDGEEFNPAEVDDPSEEDLGEADEEEAEPVSRTLFMFTCGDDIERNNSSLTNTIKEIISTELPENLNIVLMTGGTEFYNTKKKILVDENGKHVNIIPDEKQIWHLTGAKDGKPGKMVLLETCKDLKDKTYVSSYPLQKLIDYGIEHYPADKYDLTFWSHGYSVMGVATDAFCEDDAYFGRPLTMPEIIKALDDSKLEDKLEILNFDCCLMGNTETVYALSNYADYFIGSAETIPAPSQVYKDWITATVDDPTLQGFELGKVIVDSYTDCYNDKDNEFSAYKTTLNVIDVEKFIERMTPALTDFLDVMIKEAKEKGENGRYNFYDEVLCGKYAINYENGLGSVDLGNFAEMAGVCITERDNLSDDDKEMLSNAYTESSMEIIDVLNDPEVRYVQNNESFKLDASFHVTRDESGKVVCEDKIEPYGLSIFLPFNGQQYFEDYMRAMDELLEVYKDDSMRTDLYSKFKEEASLYNSIFECGKKVSTLACDGKYDPSIDDVVSDLVLAKDYDSEWLSEIVAQQNEEVIKGDSETFKVDGDAKDGEYLVSSDTVSMRTLDFVRPFFQQYVSECNDDVNMNEKEAGYKAGEIPIVLGEDDCVLNPDILEKDQENVIFERAALYENNGVSFISKEYDGTWYQLTDADGKTHLITFQRDESDDSVIKVAMLEYVIEYMGEEYEAPAKKNMQITAKVNDDGSVEITDMLMYDLWGTSEFEMPEEPEPGFKGFFTGYAENFYLDMFKLNKEFPVAFDKDKENYGLSIQSNVNIKDMDDVTDQELDKLAQDIICRDIYGVDHVVCSLK